MATEQIKNQLFLDFLKENREKLNSLFNSYKYTYRVIDKEVMFFYIIFIMEPFSANNSIRDKEKLSAFLLVLYEKILELIGKNFLGNSGRYPFFENKFIQVLEDPNDWMFENPDLYLSSVSNVILNMGTVDVIKLDAWLSKFNKLNKKAKSIQELFDAGKVVAWTCGMAQHRQKAMEIIRELDVDLLQIILDIPNIKSINRENFIARLTSDPWLKPENAMKENSPKKIIGVTRVGSFVGFGGEFLQPPQVEILEEVFIVSDQKNFYILFADVFGSYLQRISEDTYLELLTSDSKKLKSEYSITEEGKIQCGTEEILYLPLVNSSSSVANTTTLCATSPYSHSVFIVGMQ